MIGNFEIRQRDLGLLPDVINIANIGAISSIFLVEPGFQFNSTTDFETKSVWLAASTANYIHPIHNIIDSIDISEEITFKESKSNIQRVQKYGKMRLQLGIVCDPEYYANLKTYEGRDLNCYFFDSNDNLIGRLDGTAVKPFTLESINISTYRFGSITIPIVYIYIGLNDIDELEQIYTVNCGFDIIDIYCVTCTIADQTKLDGDSMTFSVTDPFGNKVDGLISSNFTITDNITGSVAISTFTEIGSGVYRFDCNKNIYNGSILIAASHYKGGGTYVFSIPEFNPTEFSNEFNIY